MTKSRKKIPYSCQDIRDDDVKAVSEVLYSDMITQGNTVPEFEKDLASYVGSKYAVAVNSATSALHIACISLGLEKNDIVWTSPNTFVSSANCALFCGAQIDFVDIDSKTYNMSVEHLQRKLLNAKKNNSLPKIVIPVHFAGQSCDMQEIKRLSDEYKFKIIEDASHAVGASYNDYKVGSCIYSDITVFSFHPVKIITTGEGGMAVTNNKILADQMKRLRTHGITTDRLNMHSRPDSEIWNYQQIELGFNYRMNDIEAALGKTQLTRIEENINKRTKIAERYNKSLENLPLILPFQLPNTRSSFHLYPIRVNERVSGKNQKDVYRRLCKANIIANLHYIPVYRQPFYEKMGFKKGYCPEAERFHKETISIPMFPSLKNKEINKVINTLQDIF